MTCPVKDIITPYLERMDARKKKVHERIQVRCCEPYRRLLKGHGFICSIGSSSCKGDCWDKAVIESFFGSLKQERVQWRHYQTHQDILDYITVFYNPVHLHSYLGYKSPNQYELDARNERKVA